MIGVREDVPLQTLARAMVIPKGVSRGIALATTSRRAAEGRLSAGKRERRPAIPAVMFYAIIRHGMAHEEKN